MNPLHQVPPQVRVYLYWAGYVLGVVSSAITAVWGVVAAALPDVAMPLWLLITQALVTLLMAQLNLLAGSNVPSLQDVVEGEVALGADYVPEHRAQG